MSPEVQRRRTPYTMKEIKAILDDRKAHKEMTTIAWAVQYPISEQLYYALKRKYELSKGTAKKTMGRPAGTKNKASAAAQVSVTPYTAKFLQAIGRKHVESLTAMELIALLENFTP